MVHIKGKKSRRAQFPVTLNNTRRLEPFNDHHDSSSLFGEFFQKRRKRKKLLINAVNLTIWTSIPFLVVYSPL